MPEIARTTLIWSFGHLYATKISIMSDIMWPQWGQFFKVFLSLKADELVTLDLNLWTHLNIVTLILIQDFRFHPK